MSVRVELALHTEIRALTERVEALEAQKDNQEKRIRHLTQVVDQLSQKTTGLPLSEPMPIPKRPRSLRDLE